MRIALASMAWNTGSNSPGELEMTCSTSDVAVCCSSASLALPLSLAKLPLCLVSATLGLSKLASAGFELLLQPCGRGAPVSHARLPTSFRWNEACDRAFGSSRPCETRLTPAAPRSAQALLAADL